jgi:hypothetical protein
LGFLVELLQERHCVAPATKCYSTKQTLSWVALAIM